MFRTIKLFIVLYLMDKREVMVKEKPLILIKVFNKEFLISMNEL